MFLAPDGDEIAIAAAAADFLADAMPIARLHEHAPVPTEDLRGQIGAMGWYGITLSEADGGSGLSAVEHALFFREVGRQCGPVDVLAQSLAAMTTTDVGLRAALIAGDGGVALAVADGATGLRLLGASDARYAVHATADGARLISLADTPTEARSPLDPATPMRLIPNDDANVVAATAGDQVWRMGQLGTAAMLIGVAEAALDMIVDYAKVRETFGRKIGSYQAVRHPCADMALRVEAARSQLWFAAAALKEGRDDAILHLEAAKHLANQAAIANADSNIQLHGGIGVTDEHNAHLLLKHALVLGKLFGAKRPLLASLLHAETTA